MEAARDGHSGAQDRTLKLKRSLDVRQQLGHTELSVPWGRWWASWQLAARTRGQPMVGDIVVSVCYRPPDQEEVDEAKNWKHPHAHRTSKVRALEAHRALFMKQQNTHTHHSVLLLDPSLAPATLNSGSPPLHNHSCALQRMVSTTCTDLLSSLHVSSLSYTPPECSAAESFSSLQP